MAEQTWGVAKMAGTIEHRGGPARRDVLRGALFGSGLGLVAGSATPIVFSRPAQAAKPPANERILVVVELSGANDGLNTVVPFEDDAYYRARPRLGLPAKSLRKIDDHFGFPMRMAGFERLYKDGQMAIVQGVGYEHPSFSHFSSMAYWHTGAPNSGDAYGWLGRLADAIDPTDSGDFLVNVQSGQSLAVRAANHVPLVFDDPAQFARGGFHDEQAALRALAPSSEPRNATEEFLFAVARSAQSAEQRVHQACASYHSPVDYGLVRFGLERVAALIAGGFGTRIFYVSYPRNAFDTHVYQADTHARLLTYVSDHISAFMTDMKRVGRADDVTMMVFSEFGRRVQENANMGTDHGTAGPVFVIGSQVRGGLYGEMPSLTNLDDGNLRYTTDFRRVYATLITQWMGQTDDSAVLRQPFAPFDNMLSA
jgi:uncharacterized protein (DUF1501 family)